jgi:hypothetical protein
VKRIPTLLDFQPNLDLEGRRVTVDRDSGRIAVRVANYGEVHSGFGPEVKVPRNANLDAAHVGTADLPDGSSLRVAVLPMHTAHAPANLQALHAAAWYENSGLGVARGRYSTDESGVRFDGLLFDDITDAQIDRLTAGSASGDWRSAIALKSFGDFEHAPADFVGSCLVNIGGYSDTYRQAPAERFALVASAAGDFISIEDATMTGTLTAGAGDSNGDGAAALPDGCNGACTGCDCQTGTTDVNTGADGAGDVVTLSASAVKALVDAVELGSSEENAEVVAAHEAATTALVAGGFMQAPDPSAERLARLEQHFVDSVFNAAD